MPSVQPKHKNEHFEAMLRRFKKAVERADIMKEVRDRECYEKPSIKRKRAKAAAKKRTQREQQQQQLNRRPH